MPIPPEFTVSSMSTSAGEEGVEGVPEENPRYISGIERQIYRMMPEVVVIHKYAEPYFSLLRLSLRPLDRSQTLTSGRVPCF